MIRKILYSVLVLVLLIAVAVGVNTLRKGSRQIAVAPLAAIAVDEAAAATRLSEAVRLNTTSSREDANLNAQQFRALHKLLE
ncbi:MAG: hypothetical protein MUE59_14770, partial [Thiobacillaceae bacterium]|nr:hypothetical protein [Thiobacillaceae bacterium]